MTKIKFYTKLKNDIINLTVKIDFRKILISQTGIAESEQKTLYKNGFFVFPNGFNVDTIYGNKILYKIKCPKRILNELEDYNFNI